MNKGDSVRRRQHADRAGATVYGARNNAHDQTNAESVSLADLVGWGWGCCDAPFEDVGCKCAVSDLGEPEQWTRRGGPIREQAPWPWSSGRELRALSLCSCAWDQICEVGGLSGTLLLVGSATIYCLRHIPPDSTTSEISIKAGRQSLQLATFSLSPHHTHLQAPVVCFSVPSLKQSFR